MSELATRPPSLPAERENADRTVGTIVYGLYLVAPVTFGLSALAGMAMAMCRRAQAGPVAATHFRFQLWTFGATAFAVGAGGLWWLLGALGTVAGRDSDVGWLALSGLALAAGAGVAYLGATVYGLARLLSRSPVGRFLSR